MTNNGVQGCTGSLRYSPMGQCLIALPSLSPAPPITFVARGPKACGLQGAKGGRQQKTASC